MREVSTAFDLLDTLFDELFGRLLQRRIQRRVDAQSPLVDALPSEAIDEIASHLLFEVQPGGLLDAEPVHQFHRRRFRGIRGGRVDRAGPHHRLDDDVAAGNRAIEVHRRGIARRRLNEAGKERRLCDCQVAGGLAEIAARSGLDAVEAVAEIDLVQVQLEDLVLGVEVLDVGRENDFFQFPAKRLVAAEEALARELLRDGASALGTAPFPDIADHGGSHTYHIDAVVLVEALVLDRDDGLDEIRRHPFERNLDALFLEDREDGLVGRVEQRRGLGHVPDVAQRVAVGQPGRQVVAEPGNPARAGEQADRQDTDDGDERAGAAGQPGSQELEAG